MKVTFYLFVMLFTASSFAVVKRHDIPAHHYKLDKAPTYLIDMPYEGHGVLIAPQWIVTVAHTIFYDYVGKKIQLGNQTLEITQVHIHPEYIEPDKSLFTGDAAPLIQVLNSRSDIALLKLSEPVETLIPIEIYPHTNEQGKEIIVFGRGATGNGKTGEDVETKFTGQLHHFQNIVENTDRNWLSYTFDAPSTALPLEGMHGAGDSGGASVIVENNQAYLVGLSSWQTWQGDLASFKGGLYGATAYQVRISSYLDWINQVLAHTNNN